MLGDLAQVVVNRYFDEQPISTIQDFQRKAPLRYPPLTVLQVENDHWDSFAQWLLDGLYGTFDIQRDFPTKFLYYHLTGHLRYGQPDGLINLDVIGKDLTYRYVLSLDRGVYQGQSTLRMIAGRSSENTVFEHDHDQLLSVQTGPKTVYYRGSPKVRDFPPKIVALVEINPGNPYLPQVSYTIEKPFTARRLSGTGPSQWNLNTNTLTPDLRSALGINIYFL